MTELRPPGEDLCTGGAISKTWVWSERSEASAAAHPARPRGRAGAPPESPVGSRRGQERSDAVRAQGAPATKGEGAEGSGEARIRNDPE